MNPGHLLFYVFAMQGTLYNVHLRHHINNSKESKKKIQYYFNNNNNKNNSE